MKKLLTLFLLVGITMGASAQKYAHLNFGNLVALMSETKDADTQMKNYRDSLTTALETRATAFEEKAKKFIADVQSGGLPPVQQQQQQATLEKEQQEIIAFEQQQLPALMQERRAKLLNPIVEKAEKAIQTVAKENGYTMVFDTSIPNAILFVEETDDLLPMVKTKLGIKDAPPAEEKKN